MVRSVLSLLLALVLLACGSSFALAQSEDEDPCSETLAAVAQVEDDSGLDDEEFVDEEDDWVDDEEDGSDDEGFFEDDEFGDDFEDDFEDEFDDESDPCEELFEDEETDDDEDSDEDATTSDERTRHGTGGDDRFIGDPGVNHFYGRGGNDYLDGGRGRDGLNGGTGNDKILTGRPEAGASKKSAKKKGAKKPKGAEVKAGKGNDVVKARNGQVDKIHCGKGKDSVVADRADKVRERNCETIKYR